MKKVISFILAVIALFCMGSNALATSIIPVEEMTPEQLQAYIAFLQTLAVEDSAEPIPEATDKPDTFSATMNGKTYTGTYSGDTENGVPHGEGRFEGTAGEKQLIYEGYWENGAIKGTGYIEVENFVIHYDDSEGGYDREGPFKGQIVDGIPEGNGSFETVNSEGIPWSYTGEWKAGSFHGQGVQEWDSPDGKLIYTGEFKDGNFNGQGVEEWITPDGKLIYTGEFKDGYYNGYGVEEWITPDGKVSFSGTFVNGEFSPTWGEYLYTFAANGYMEGVESIPTGSKEFIDKHPHLFDSSAEVTISASMVNTSFDIKQFKKYPQKYADKLVYIPQASVVSVTPVEDTISYERILFRVEGETWRDATYYRGFHNGPSDIVEGMQIAAHILPLDYIEGSDDFDYVFCTITSDIHELYETLKKGSKGDDVLKLKSRLQELGYIGSTSTFNATYNDSTVEKIKQFQKANDLPVTGIADHQTQRVLYSSSAKPMP